MSTPFHFFNILTSEECKKTLSILDQLSTSWICRRAGIPFYTLGTPAYLDGSAPKEIYKKRVLEMNSLLNTHFSDLLEKVRHLLEIYLQAPLLNLPGASLPGFHIFESSPLFTQPLASVHFDLQYEMLSWPQPPCLDSVISFTLPLILPENGGGLNWWDADFKTFHLLEPCEQNKIIATLKKHFLPYKAGKLVLHNGHLLHQIAPTKVMLPFDQRITLQGHAARAGKNYYWYW